ncbi:MAG: hypothetical protein KF852_04125 [Saprospiraceae bacterium]|nr:hypothetical protein [Saprospiraceae bacterium]
MKNNNLVVALAIAVGVYFLTKKPVRPQFSTAPRPPVDPRQAQTQAQIIALQNWIRTMIALFGNVKELWQPGGPFYNIPRAIFDDINISPPTPGADPGGQYV